MPAQITPLSAPPTRADPVSFAGRADTFLSELPTLAVEMNAAILEINDNALTASAAKDIAILKRNEAVAAASAASDSAASASSSAAFASESARLFLGAKSAPPTVDNDGNPLILGMRYYDTRTGKERVYGNTGWEDGISAVAGVSSFNGMTGAVEVPPASQVEMEAGTETNLRMMSPERVRQAIAALTSATPVRAPVNVTPAQAAVDVAGTPTLTGSAFLSLYGLAMAAAQFQVSTAADFATTVVSTGDIPGTATTYTVAAGVLAVSTMYYWRARYKDAEGVYSAWSTPTSFTTDAELNSYIPTPTPTPANFGDPLEGGFYAGMVWGQIAQSSTSMAIATGSKTFTVPSMTNAPIVYADQQLEIRSRANPANKMVGVVTGAAGTSLTINVTSVGGSGTFSDWSVMSRYRVIVAPKASGEHAGIALKKAYTALPTACQTLTEGFAATQAMRDADTSTVYPAAHWARNLNIGGRADWYIPARDELELCWRNLKPVTNNNYVTADRPTGQTFDYKTNGSYGDTANTHGLNNNSVPVGAAYTTSVPARTTATAFQTGGAEAFEYGSAYYWSCSDYNAAVAWSQGWYSSFPGYQGSNSKTDTYRVRAARRSII